MDTVVTSSSGGTDSKSSGGAPETHNNPENLNALDGSSESPQRPEKVDYSTYDKAVKEKKKLSERLNVLESERKQREEKELREKGDLSALLSAREKELAETQGKLAKYEERITKHAKLRAVLEGLNGTVDNEYLDLVPVHMVEIDPETGKPDPESVAKARKVMETKYARVIAPKEVKLPPSDAARGSEKLDFKTEIQKAKTQKELEAIATKYGKI